MRIKSLAQIALLSTVALAVYALESQIPPLVPIPGVKLGLANVMTLFTMSALGRRQAAFVLTVRLILGSMFAGSISALFFSAAGGALAFAVMALTLGRLGEGLIWAVSALAAVAHNFGQLAVAVLVTGTPGIVIWTPALLASGIVTGVFTGLCAGYLLRALKGTVR